MNIFISGTSRGIGEALAQHYSVEHNVFGISRSESKIKINHIQADLTDYQNLEDKINELLGETDEIDIAFLNAGVLGKIQTMQEAQLDEMKYTMDVNLWSQKVLIDILLKRKLKTVIAISSGAAVNGNMGWSAYSLSKAALNMLIQLYANEYSQTKFIALAPGLVDTNMQEIISNEDSKKFPSLERLQSARGTQAMPMPSDFVNNFIDKKDVIMQTPSGGFIDIRKI